MREGGLGASRMPQDVSTRFERGLELLRRCAPDSLFVSKCTVRGRIPQDGRSSSHRQVVHRTPHPLAGASGFSQPVALRRREADDGLDCLAESDFAGEDHAA